VALTTINSWHNFRRRLITQLVFDDSDDKLTESRVELRKFLSVSAKETYRKSHCSKQTRSSDSLNPKKKSLEPGDDKSLALTQSIKMASRPDKSERVELYFVAQILIYEAKRKTFYDRHGRQEPLKCESATQRALKYFFYLFQSVTKPIELSVTFYFSFPWLRRWLLRS
jgi:hypothetical protein